MRIGRAELHFLKIPLRLSVSHGARAGRTQSDSIVLEIKGTAGASGHGEAVVREYVSGMLEGAAGFRQEAAALVGRMLEPFRRQDFIWDDVKSTLAARPCTPQELPFLCAVETALLDLACAEAQADAYAVLGVSPLRRQVVYGGVLPIVPIEQAGAWMDRYMGMGFREVKVKLGADASYNDAILGMCREKLGPGFDIRVDANMSWTGESAAEHLSVCARHGVHMVEQPLGASGPPAVLQEARGRGFQFIADEGVLTAADVATLAERGYDVLNLRLSKNGGLSRVLALAAAAEARGLRYLLGCMVGETAILSALGRIAASLLPSPLFLEGSYDDIILTENVSDRGIGFGPGGAAEIIRGKGIGFTVNPGKLAALSVARIPC